MGLTVGVDPDGRPLASRNLARPWKLRLLAPCAIGGLTGLSVVSACTASQEQAAPGGSHGSEASSSPSVTAAPCAFLGPTAGLTILGLRVDEFQAVPDPSSRSGPTICNTVDGNERVVVALAEDLGIDPGVVVYPDGSVPVTVRSEIAHPDLDVTRISQTTEGATGASVVTVRMKRGTSVVSVGVVQVPSSTAAPTIDASALTEDALALGKRLLVT